MYTPPTSDEIQRVAEHWERVKKLTCEHLELTYSSGDSRPACSSCYEPIMFLTGLQLEDHIDHAVRIALRDRGI